MTNSVHLDFRDAVAILRLDRPEVHNAVDAGVIERLEAALDTLEASTARAVVVTGTGEKTFCAGGDLSWFSTLETRDEGLVMSRRMQEVLRRLADGPRPVIAALNGNVLGGGCEIALACHLRIAGEGIRFSFRPAALGIITGWGGGQRLFRLVGHSAAMRLLLLAETIDAEEALRLGLVDRVVDRDTVFDEALAWAEKIASHATVSIRAILELDRAVRRRDEEVAALETRLFSELWDGEDFRRSLRRWQEERRRKAPKNS